MTYFLGLDVGTTSTKANAFDRTGRMLAESLHHYPLLEPEPGAAIQDPDAIVVAVEAAVREVVQTLGHPPAAIGLSTMMHSLILVDEQGTRLSPSYTWADTRAFREAEALAVTPLGRDIFQHTGTPLHAMSPLAKILWLRRSAPDLLARTTHFCDIKSYLLHRWIGRYVVDHSIASAMGLLDIRTRDWYPPALEVTGLVPEQLPELVTPRTVLTTWRPEAAMAMGLPPDLPLIAGASDGCLANLGSGILHPGPAVLTIGTSGAIRMTSREPRVDALGRLFTYVLDDDYYVTGGASNNGGKVLEWLTRQFYGPATVAEVLEDAQTVPPGTEGLLFLPYLYGERAPIYRAEATGGFAGLRSHHTRAHFARALLEGILFNLCLSVTALEETVAPIEVIYATGGFTRSAFWVQLLADISGKRVVVTATPQASAYGAALMARRAIGEIDAYALPERQLEHAQTFEPDAKRHGVYQGVFVRWREVFAVGS